MLLSLLFVFIVVPYLNMTFLWWNTLINNIEDICLGVFYDMLGLCRILSSQYGLNAYPVIGVLATSSTHRYITVVIVLVGQAEVSGETPTFCRKISLWNLIILFW